MLLTIDHTQRIKDELRATGMTAYGSAKFASRYLPSVIHPNEHIKAAVYGRYREGAGLLSFTAGMLVATDRRIIFLDHKPGYTAMDEVTYQVVAGVKGNAAWPFAAVTLHTRMNDYTIRYANAHSVDKFTHYIEKRRLEEISGAMISDNSPVAERPGTAFHLDEPSLTFLRRNDTAVLSTVGRAGSAYGAAVYYALGEDNNVYVLTRANTQKSRNMFGHQQVALTVYDAEKLQTVQLTGVASVESDPTRRNQLFSQLVRPHQIGSTIQTPPVTNINQEGYVLMRITPVSARFIDFAQKPPEI
ncbi:MAG: PH domain-containing protein [Candidatus Saccharimonadales bacterium]